MIEDNDHEPPMTRTDMIGLLALIVGPWIVIIGCIVAIAATVLALRT